MIFLHFLLLCYIIKSKKNIKIYLSGRCKQKDHRSSPVTKEQRSLLLNTKTDINFDCVKICVKL